MRFWWGQLIDVGPPVMERLVNARLLAPVWLALIGFSLAGSFVDGLLVALGAYIVLFGAGQPPKRRLLTFATCAVMLLLSITCGMLAAGSSGWVLLSYLGIAVLATAVDVVIPLGPPGPYFFVLMVGGGTLLGPSGLSLGHTLPLLALGSAAAAVVSLGDTVRDRYAVEKSAVTTAESAVHELRKAIDAGQVADNDQSSTNVLDNQLAAAAEAVHHAWTAVLSGGGSGDVAAHIEARLRLVHTEYQRMYLATVASPNDSETNPGEARAVAAATPATAIDPRRTALGPPRLRYRLATALHWPSPTLVTAIRVSAAVVVATLVSGLLGDRHPFWTVLVVLLVLSYPGDQQHLTLRAVQRLSGTCLGVVVFSALMGITLPTEALVLVVCALLWVVSRFAARNYLIGSFFITLLALYLVAPLSPSQSPSSLAMDRVADTAIGVALSLALIWLVGSTLTVPLTKASIHWISQGSITVLSDLAHQRESNESGFVEHRRQLQKALMKNGAALKFASSRAQTRARPYREFEQQCVRMGYIVLGEAWRSNRAGADEYEATCLRLRDIVKLALTTTTVDDVRLESERLGALMRRG